MTREDFIQAMEERGFFYDLRSNQWRGSFGITYCGDLNFDQRPSSNRARDEALQEIDERLRAGRGICRPPPYPSKLKPNTIGSFPPVRLPPDKFD